MKNLITAIALLMFSQVSWAGSYDCGVVNGHSIQVTDGPVLVVDGVSVALQVYNQDTFGKDYVSADGLYVWSVRTFSNRLYNAKPEFLASCSAPNGSGGAPSIRPYDPNDEIPTWGANPGGGWAP